MKISKETVWGGVVWWLDRLFCIFGSACAAALIAVALHPAFILGAFVFAPIFWPTWFLAAIIIPWSHRLGWRHYLLNLAVPSGVLWCVSTLPSYREGRVIMDQGLDVLLASGVYSALGFWLLVTVYLSRYRLKRR